VKRGARQFGVVRKADWGFEKLRTAWWMACGGALAKGLSVLVRKHRARRIKSLLGSGVQKDCPIHGQFPH